LKDERFRAMMLGKKYGKFFQPSIWPYYPRIPIFRLLKDTAKRIPDKLAVLYPRNTTFKELDVLSDKLAAALVDLGVNKGDAVALFMWNSPEFIISFFGALKSGAIVTALNPSFKYKEAKFQLEDSEAVIAIVDNDKYKIIEKIKAELSKLEKIIVLGKKTVAAFSLKELLKRCPPTLPSVEIDPVEDVAVLQYTSGTTGLPKGCMLTHYNVVSNIIQCSVSPALEIRESDIFLSHLPFYHIYGMTWLVCVPMRMGISQVIMKRFEVKEFLRLIQEFKVTVVFTVMPVITLLANSPKIEEYDISSLRFINNGGTSIVPSVVRKFEKLTKVPVINGYGLSEASPVTNTNPLCCIKHDSVGPPLPDTEEKIVDLETGTKELPVGEIGELIIKGPQIMKGYWKRPKETAEALRDGWLYTEDVAKMDEDGYVYIIDRKKEIIKYKGFTVGPAELEAVLMEHPAVADCAVIGKPDPIAGEIPKAFVVLKKCVKTSEEELIKFVEDRVAGYKKIREVEFVNSISRSASGKILRKKFIELERRRAAGKQ
jgi:long-chain acyl-CoA synthetase